MLQTHSPYPYHGSKLMKLKHFAGALLAASFFACPLYLLSRSNGAPPASSGGDFPGEGSCTSSGCHDDGQANQGAGAFSMLINDEPADQFRYTPGETATVSVRLNDPAAARIGFQLTARAGDGCDPGGTLMPGEQERQVSVSSGECNANSVQWATHTLPKAGNDATFSVAWTAPMSDVGAVTLAAAGNGANGNGNSAGDNIYQMQAVIQPADDSGGPAPSISSGGVVLATLAPAVTTGAPNAIATVFGAEFAPAGTSALAPQLDDAGKVATALAETCVEVGSRRAPIFAVTPGQINFQIPDQAVRGPQAVNVIRGCGTADERRSADESFNIAAAQPAFFLLNAGASLAAVAIHQDQVNTVGPADLIPGVTTPAAPGEYIILYGTGFGATDPPLTAGQIPARVYPDEPLTRLASTDVRVAFGDIEVAPTDIFYIGGAPCCAGLYQLTVKVPDNAPNGELPVTLTIDGVASPEGPFVAVQSATPADGYAPLALWAVADGRIILGGGVLDLTECLPVDDLQFPPLTGSVYTVHTSRWQRREDENSPWTDIAGTERMGQLCPYTATQSGQYRGVGDATIDGERAMYSSANFFTKIGYTPLPLWAVADGRIILGGGVLDLTECLPVDDLQFPPLTGSVYTVHTSKWQRREDENSLWTDIANTEQMGQLCPYTATQPGQYRGVADATIDGERAMYSSANFFTKE